MFADYLNKESQTETGFLFLTTKREVNQRNVSTGEFLTLLTRRVLKTYREKQDTPEFHAKVKKMTEIFNDEIELKPIGDYGVIYSYIITSKPVFLEENQIFLENFAKQLINNQKQKVNKEQSPEL